MIIKNVNIITKCEILNNYCIEIKDGVISNIAKNIDTDKVNFSFVNSTQPVLIEPEEEVKYKYIIMPVRV